VAPAIGDLRAGSATTAGPDAIGRSPSTRPRSSWGLVIRAGRRRSKRKAMRGNPNPAFRACRGRCRGRKDADFSLSGLKTALRLEWKRKKKKIAPLFGPRTSSDLLRFVPSRRWGRRSCSDPLARGPCALFRAKYGAPSAAGRCRRRRRQSGHPQGSASPWPSEVGSVLVAPAARIVYRQRRHDSPGPAGERLALGLTDRAQDVPQAAAPALLGRSTRVACRQRRGVLAQRRRYK